MTMDFDRRALLKTGGGAMLAMPGAASAALTRRIDSVDEAVLGFQRTFEIPGLAIAVVRPGQPPLVRGYGVRTLGRPERVDGDTLFAIASNSKSFTAALLAMLVDERRIGWETPVASIMPEFRTSDPAITREMTIRDLLVHRSGLALGAGDLMQFPEPDFSREEIVAGLRYLPFARGFRSGYAYDNILYVVAGRLIEHLTAQSWEAAITGRILRPLGMHASAASLKLVGSANIAGRHARIGPPLRGFGPMQRVRADETDAGAPAGGINASAREIVQWLRVQLRRGQAPGGPMRLDFTP
jgi:CubicO group peptidase (beta-lactamase class C family)